MKSDSVAAVIVTFNRLALLKECIAALQMQSHPLDAVIVINNASTDGTEEWLTQQPIITTITQENKGGAAGFYTGIKTAFEKGFEWIWCMDDDGQPAPTALEKLMALKDRKPCVLNSLVLDKNNPDTIVFPSQNLKTLSDITTPVLDRVGTFFNATLFHRDVVEMVGLPLKELVIWGDETEYQFRINNKFRIPLLTVTDSHHYHPAQFSKFYRRDWNLATGWKMYFFTRNKAFVYQSKFAGKLKARIAYASFVSSLMLLTLLLQKSDRLPKLRLLRKAAQDGFARKTNATIQEIQAYANNL